MEPYIETIQGLVESRNTFIGRTMNQFRPAERPGVYNQFMLNERMYLELLYRVLNQEIRIGQNTQQVVLNIPASFLDPIAVSASAAQIADSLRAMEHPSGTCAICQDSITTNGTEIRQCGHMYHRECITSWLTMSVRCPVCRHDIRESSVSPQAQTSAGAE